MRAFVAASALLILTTGAAPAATISNSGGVQIIVDGPTPAPARTQRPRNAPKPGSKPQAGATAATASGRTQQGALEGTRLAQYALAFVGTPYVWGGSTPRGFDCSGFTQYVYAALGVGIPRTADMQFLVGTATADPQPGDLLFFQTYALGASHVAIYLGGGWFVQSIGSDVHISNFNAPYFRSRYIGARRVLPA